MSPINYCSAARRIAGFRADAVVLSLLFAIAVVLIISPRSTGIADGEDASTMSPSSNANPLGITLLRLSRMQMYCCYISLAIITVFAISGFSSASWCTANVLFLSATLPRRKGTRKSPFANVKQVLRNRSLYARPRAAWRARRRKRSVLLFNRTNLHGSPGPRDRKLHSKLYRQISIFLTAGTCMAMQLCGAGHCIQILITHYAYG